MTPLLEAADAAFTYPERGGAVGPFSLAVGPGELHHIRGPSGCGKSTFARMLAGLIPHLYRGQLRGTVRAGGRLTTETPMWELSARVGLVGQNPPAQLLTAAVRDEIVFGLENLGLDAAAVARRVETTLDDFGLGSVADRDPRGLSGGEQQKVVLAAIAARRPGVIVLDEALSMLDAEAVREVAAHVQRLRDAGTAVVAFEHRPPVDAWKREARCHALASPLPAELPLPEIPERVAPFQLRVEHLGVTLGGREVLHEVDLLLTGGQVVGVVGANGAGKTTLLRALAGLQTHHGRVGDDAGREPRLGLCFQNPDQQIFNATVSEEIRFGNARLDERHYRCVVELLGLAPYERTPPLLLSEGEKKRLALAVLLTRPALRGLCLDEPTLGQDDRYRRGIGRVVRHLASAGYLCVVATHDREWAARWCDTAVVLDGGRVVAQTAAAGAERAGCE